MAGEKKDKRISTVTERFCSFLGDNAVIITTQTPEGKEHKCIYSESCKGDCKHNRITEKGL